MNGLKVVEDLALYLHKEQGVKVFKFRKPTNFNGEYIVVNHLPFTYGEVVNDDNILNVNIHAPKLSSGNADIERLTEIYNEIYLLIPCDIGIEEQIGVEINGCYYSIISCSQPIEDEDNTFFLNIKVKVIINQLKF